MKQIRSIVFLTIFTVSALISFLPQPGFPQGAKDSDRNSASVLGFLKDVIIFSQPQKVMVELAGDGVTADYRSFTLNQPPRLVIDFPRVQSSFPKKYIAVEHPLLKDIRLGQQPDRLRFVLTFPAAEIPPHRLIRETGRLIILVGKKEKDLEEEKKPEPTQGSDAPRAPDDPNQAKNPEAENPSVKVYSGEKITLDFIEADIRRIFALLSEVSQRQIVLSDQVQGTVTLRLVEVPWDQVLDVILSIYNLKRVDEGSLIRILPRSS